MTETVEYKVKICGHLKPTEVWEKIEDIDGVEVQRLQK